MGSEEHIGNPDFDDSGDEEIGEDEREALEQDLVDVKTLKAVLGSRGVKGVVVFCPDCDDDHFLGWDLLAGNLQQILESGRPPVHEPAWEPDPDEYVTWDYARGFLGHFDPRTGKFLEERASPGGAKSKPYGIAVTSDGVVWYSESGVTPNTLVPDLEASLT